MSFHFERKLYIVAADPKRHERHALHSLTAQHLLTRDPQPGDTIHAVLHVTEERALGEEEEGGLGLVGLGVWYAGTLRGHAGRSALLGEDTLEPPADVLPMLLRDLYAEGGCPWRYAPVAWEDSEQIVKRGWAVDGDTWTEDMDEF